MSVEYKVVNPATGEVESQFPTATDAEIATAIDALRRGLPQLEHDAGRRARPPAAPGRRPLRRAHHRAGGAHHPRDGQDHGRGRRRDRVRRRHLPLLRRPGPDACSPTSRSRRRPAATRSCARAPIGPLLGIMPWNYPYYQVARFAGPNLMAGNTILLKHAPQCPESALAMEQLFRDAGLKSDEYVNIFASNEQVADIIADPRVRGVSVTGSERAGTAVASLAGQHLKKVVLELGGSDAFIVLGHRRPPRRRRAGRGLARMENGGQACNAAKRFIVAEPLYDDVRRPVHRGHGRPDHRRPVRPRDVLRPALVRGGRRRPHGAGAGRDRQGRHRPHRRHAVPTGPARSSTPPCSPT